MEWILLHQEELGSHSGIDISYCSQNLWARHLAEVAQVAVRSMAHNGSHWLDTTCSQDMPGLKKT